MKSVLLKYIDVVNILFKVFVSSMFFLFFSCADSSPKVSKVEPSIVFDYSKENEYPDMYLTVFVKTESNNRRAKSLEIKSLENPFGIEWIVSNPEIFSINGEMYVFSKRLKPISDGKILIGKYQVIYKDAADEEVISEFFLSYDEKYLNLKKNNLESVLSDYQENIALYDEEKKMIYEGSVFANWQSNDDIIKDYDKVAFKRKIYFSKNEEIVFLLPLEILK